MLKRRNKDSDFIDKKTRNTTNIVLRAVKL